MPNIDDRYEVGMNEMTMYEKFMALFSFTKKKYPELGDSVIQLFELEALCYAKMHSDKQSNGFSGWCI